jgi:PadR family transcriptional regulator, regulatory protein PadR
MVNLRRDMITGLVRVRILRAAAVGPISGVEVSQDLATAGHQVSPGTLYPILHTMEKAGWLKSTGKTVKGKRRRYYRVTKKGRNQLDQALSALNAFLSGMVSSSAPHAGRGLEHDIDFAPDGFLWQPESTARTQGQLFER